MSEERYPKEKAESMGYCDFLCLHGRAGACRNTEAVFCLATEADRERWEKNITTLYADSIKATKKRTRRD